MAKGVRVLIVEDDRAIADLYRFKLELDGYEVRLAVDGNDALAQLQEASPDLVFLDLDLPGLDGLAVLEAATARGLLAKTAVVVLSNFIEPEIDARARELGAADCLIKADTPLDSLVGRIPAWIGAGATSS
jgi:CheY-like chemotaxis protein